MYIVMIGQYGRYFVNTGPEVQKIKIVIIIKIKTYLEMNSKCSKKDIKWNNPRQIMKITYKTFLLKKTKHFNDNIPKHLFIQDIIYLLCVCVCVHSYIHTQYMYVYIYKKII